MIQLQFDAGQVVGTVTTVQENQSRTMMIRGNAERVPGPAPLIRGEYDLLFEHVRGGGNAMGRYHDARRGPQPVSIVLERDRVVLDRLYSSNSMTAFRSMCAELALEWMPVAFAE